MGLPKTVSTWVSERCHPSMSLCAASITKPVNTRCLKMNQLIFMQIDTNGAQRLVRNIHVVGQEVKGQCHAVLK